MFSKLKLQVKLAQIEAVSMSPPTYVHLKSRAVSNLYLSISLSSQIGVVLLFP